MSLCVSGCFGSSKEKLYAKGLAELSKSNPKGAIVYFRNALEKDRDYYEARLELAKAFRMAGQYELSEKEFAQLLARPPVRPDLKLEVVKLHIVAAKYDQALKELEGYARAHGASAEYSELSGIAHALKNNPAQAITSLLQALKTEPSRVSAKLELAHIYLYFRISDKRADARRLIEEVLRSQPNNVRALYLLVDLEAAAGNRDNVENLYIRIAGVDGAEITAPYRLGLLYLAKGDLARTEAIAANLLKKHPDRAEGLTLNGIVAVHKKQYRDAVVSLQKAIKQQTSGEASYYLGLGHYSLGEFEYALRQLAQIADASFFSQPARALTAQIFIKQKRFDDAISTCRKLLAVNPSHTFAHTMLGSAYLAKGMNDEGIKEFKRSIELDPKNTDLYLKKGMANLMRGRAKEAETDFITATHIAPELANARLILSGFYLREKEYAKAMATLEQGITGKKSDAVLYARSAAILFARNRPDEALKSLQKAKQVDPEFLEASFDIALYYSVTNQPEKALQEYREIIGKHPDNARALIGMAAFLENSGRDSEAKTYYTAALKTGQAPAYLTMAAYWLRKGKEEKALSVLDDGIKAVAGNLDALRLKMEILVSRRKYSEALQVCEDMGAISPQQGLKFKVGIYLQMKDYQKAVAAASQYIIINSASAFGHMVMADIYDSRNEQDAAIHEMKEGVRKEPGNLTAEVKLGEHLAKKGDFKAAADTYSSVLRKDPEFIPAMFGQGALLEKMGMKKDAIDRYKAVLGKSERFAPALNNLAYIYINDSVNLQEGLRLAELAARLEPSNPSILDTLGLALLKNKRGDAARQVLEKALSLAPSNALAAYHLALVHQENGNRDLAVKSLRQSLTQGNFPEADNARKLLERLK